MYYNKDSNTHTSDYDRVLNALKKLDNFYNTTMPKINDPVLEIKYKVTGEESLQLCNTKNIKSSGRAERLSLQTLDNLRHSRKR